MDRILHIVQESFENPRHRFLGSVKDSLGRQEYFATRGLPVDRIVAEGRSDHKVAATLASLDLRQYRVAVFELPIYPKSLQLLRRRAPHVRRWIRPINAELLQQIDLFRAHRAHPYAQDHRAQLLHDVMTGYQRFRQDWVCARRSDALLSISDWESEHYWRWVAGRVRTWTVPYFLPSEFRRDIPRNVEKQPLCVCPLSTAKSIRPFPLDAFQNFARLVRAYRLKPGPWKFAMTGALKVNHRWNHMVDSELIVKGDIEQLGFLDDPMTLFAQARAVAVLSDLGFGVKTKILDAIAARCWVLVTPGLYSRLAPELQPYCLVVDRLEHVAGFRAALDRAMQPFPEPDPNDALRDRAFTTLDKLMEAE